MRKTIIIEGIAVSALGLLGVAEAIRLMIEKASLTVQDMLGPGPYILVVSVPLIVIGIVHLAQYKREMLEEKETVNRGMRKRMVGIIAAFALYTVLLNYIGYLISTIFFFIFEFKAVGVKSWRTNIILSLTLTTAYYVVFIKYCNLVFPRGIFF